MAVQKRSIELYMKKDERRRNARIKNAEFLEKNRDALYAEWCERREDLLALAGDIELECAPFSEVMELAFFHQALYWTHAALVLRFLLDLEKPRWLESFLRKHDAIDMDLEEVKKSIFGAYAYYWKRIGIESLQDAYSRWAGFFSRVDVHTMWRRRRAPVCIWMGQIWPG